MRKLLLLFLLLFATGCATALGVHPLTNPEHFGGLPHYERVTLADTVCLGITTRHDILRRCSGGTCEEIVVQSFAKPGYCEALGPAVLQAISTSLQYRWITWSGDTRVGPEFYNVNQQSQEQEQTQEQAQRQKFIRTVPKKWRSPGWGAK